MIVIIVFFECVKVIFQVQGQKQFVFGEKLKYSGGMDVVCQFYCEGGVCFVFCGFVVIFVCDGFGLVVYFVVYEYCKWVFIFKDFVIGEVSGKLSLMVIICVGVVVGVVMWIFVFFIDMVKSRLQIVEGNVMIGGVVKGLYVKGGYKVFFFGFGFVLVRVVFVNVVIFLGVELVYQVMNKVFN